MRANQSRWHMHPHSLPSVGKPQRNCQEPAYFLAASLRSSCEALDSLCIGCGLGSRRGHPRPLEPLSGNRVADLIVKKLSVLWPSQKNLGLSNGVGLGGGESNLNIATGGVKNKQNCCTCSSCPMEP